MVVSLGAHAAAYYSTGTPISASPTRTCTIAGCTTGVTTDVTTPVGTVAISATAYLPLAGTTKLRYQLNGIAPAGYRGGVLLSPNSSLVSLSALGGIAIRTYLSTNPTKVQDEMLVSASAAGAQLLAGKGNPVQMELISTASFDQVEVEFGAIVSLGTSINVHYAYGIGPNVAAQIMGLTSNASGSNVGQYRVTGCTDKVNNAAQTVDNDPTNYATFSSLASVNCPAQLMVNLTGTAPGTYKAGFVVGQGNNLLDVSVLSHLTLKTYKNGVLQETASGASLLGLSVLPDGKSLINFQASQPFDAVSIERNDAVALLDDLRLYYGVGVASTSPQQTISSFTDPSTHYQTSYNTTVCALCTVSSPENAASNPNSAATITVGAGVNNTTGLRLDLNGQGNAGNRAGMVIGNNTLLDVAALSRITLTTYDNAGNVLETASGSSLLSVNVLPDGRQTISFNTTKDFSKVGIQVGGLASLVSNTSVYYAFSDSSNGSLNIVAPTSPLPVSLISFTARRQSGGAVLSWATASEVNSARFVVERATDLVAGFSAIGEVAAAGTTNTPRTYALQDKEAASLAGTLYYRLRQLDLDGHAYVSAIVVLDARPANAVFSLYPNPAPAATQQVTLAGTVAAGYSVSLYSGMGQLLSTRVVSSEATTAPLAVPTGGLAAGIYHVVLRDAAGQLLTTQRLQVAGQ
ncbi:T9SS type A sorting domain-containing protein [Hymenobacter sp. CA2-7]|nr:T9SS type A sorting domain-containing protein [Hymenobacter sp. CA2-7]